MRGFFFATMNFPLPIVPAVINHLLSQEPWAREKLSPHIGKTACLNAGVAAVKLKVRSDNLLESVDVDSPANVTIHVKLSDLPLIMQNRDRAFSYVKVEGDADFANTLSQLSQSLRWEAEEDLSRWVGDIAATRIVSGAKSAFETAKATHQTVVENVAEYFLEENPMLMRPQSITDFSGDVAKLRDDVERLAKRIEKLSTK
jgi:ubiquinone biosynthesis protein UbiJ